jgi:hypothetical protein
MFTTKQRARRCVLLLVGGVALLLGVAMLHPYPRQSLFGPMVRGKPRCVWQAELRRIAGPESVTDTLTRWLHVEREAIPQDELFDHPEMVPLVVELVEDGDFNLRGAAMNRIAMYKSLQDPAALPALHRWLREDYIHNRLLAARAIWQIDRDSRVLNLFREMFADSKPGYRALGMSHAATFADAAELFPDIAALASDPDHRVREPVMYAMRHHGKKGVPILILGLQDEQTNVRLNAAWSLATLGARAADAVPALKACLNDPNMEVRTEAAEALERIEYDRRKQLKGTGS